MAIFLGLPRWASTRKVKPIWILLKQETVNGSGISWAICKFASRSRQITIPVPHNSFFTGRMPFLPPNEQRQSTEGKLGRLQNECIKSSEKSGTDLTDKTPLLSPNQRQIIKWNSKHWYQPRKDTHSPHPFFIHHQNAELLRHALFALALWYQYHKTPS